MSRFGATIFGCEGRRLGAAEAAFFREAQPFGFILFGRNIGDAAQIRALCDALRNSVGREAPILIDQEGGRVQRLRAPLATDWSPPLDFVSAAGARAERALFLRYALTAAELRRLGIDTNCAPMLDVVSEGTHEFLRNRCYGDDPALVARLGRAVADGLLAGGVMPVVKHIPGHGRSRVDSHLDLPRVTVSRAELERDFAPFRALSDLGMGMTAHLVYEAYDPRPATVSAEMLRLIREDIGFDGLLMTDDISMQALAGSLSERSAAALAAGCDVVLHCNGALAEMAAVADAAGAMSPRAQARAEAALAVRPAAAMLDIPALTAELEALF
ncbi:glycoside hydrolase family 3 N-terminal domain-containing protein [Shimia sp.]|uniref:glycoside hydrolase family 3 N-terminal domain-containing protein n=1 Tax=Shimia sp. TaxID=1954381 RepID=UPI0035669DD7